MWLGICNIHARYLEKGYLKSAMKRILNIVLLPLTLSLMALPAFAQDDTYDVFVPIAKYIGQGNAGKLSAWFADNLEITVISSAKDTSSNQARQIMKSFFDSYTPRSFEITHTAGRSNMKYALGALNAGGEMFMVTIFVSYSGSGYRIQQLKIERMR